MTAIWDETAVLDGLLSTVPVVDGRRRWDLADPYLWRHLLQHAQDTDRAAELLTDRKLLVYATPESVLSCLQDRTDPSSQLLNAVYRTAYQPRRWNNPHTRRDLLAIETARYRTDWTIPPPPDQPGTWQPRWATGSRISPTTPHLLTDNAGTPIAVAITTINDQAVAVTTSHDHTVRIWDLTTREPLGEPLTGHTDTVNGVACTTLDDRPIAVTTSNDHTVRIWDLTTQQALGQPLTGHTDTVNGVACTTLHGRPIAVTTSNDHTVRAWDLVTQSPYGAPIYLPERGQVIEITESGDIIIGFGWDIAYLSKPDPG